MAPVRKDRKFYFSLELHREIDRSMQNNPEFGREPRLEGAEKVPPTSAARLSRSATSGATCSSPEQLHFDLTSEDEHSVEMRNVTVFLGIMSQERRKEIVDETVARRLPL